LLIYKINIRLVFILEYLLEYLHQDFIKIRLAAFILLVKLEDRVAEGALLGSRIETLLSSLCTRHTANSLVLFEFSLRRSEK
jgi:hypothetical protein